MSEAVFPEDLAIKYKDKIYKINWFRQIGESIYFFAGLVCNEEGNVFYMKIGEEGFEVIEAYSQFTDEEHIAVIELILNMRANPQPPADTLPE